MFISKQLHLGLFIYPGGHHIAAWRHPDAAADSMTRLDYYRTCAQLAERGKFDLFFVGDALAAREKDDRVIGEVSINNLDPVSLVSAISAVTERIGLVATLSTTFNEPYYIAAKFATLDHLSGGRAGWNVVTTSDDDAAFNFSRKSHMEKTLRYERAKEFVDVVTGLWDSWGDDAVVMDRSTGQYLDPTQVRTIDHSGQFFTVRGPSRLPRPVQGWPVLVQAGGSPPGRRLAAMIGEAIFTAQGRLEDGRSFRSTIHELMAEYGRAPQEVKILPGFSPIIGSTEREAKRKEEELNDLVHPQVGVWMLSERFKFRLYEYPPHGRMPVADIREQVKTLNAGAAELLGRFERENLTILESARIIARSRNHQSFVGTLEQLVDHMGRWLNEGGCDGFNILPAYFPGELEVFVEQVVPELQRRGLFRKDYEGETLRDHLGLARPPSKYQRTRSQIGTVA